MLKFYSRVLLITKKKFQGKKSLENVFLAHPLTGTISPFFCLKRKDLPSDQWPSKKMGSSRNLSWNFFLLINKTLKQCLSKKPHCYNLIPGWPSFWHFSGGLLGSCLKMPPPLLKKREFRVGYLYKQTLNAYISRRRISFGMRISPFERGKVE